VVESCPSPQLKFGALGLLKFIHLELTLDIYPLIKPLLVPTQTTTGILFSLCRSKSFDFCPVFGQLQETTIEKFEKTVKDDNIPIVISTSDDSPLQLNQYVETWRVQVWDSGFMSMFRGKDAFSKTKSFKDQKHCDLAVKRVMFRLVSCSQSDP
jgi:hypothetical protein